MKIVGALIDPRGHYARLRRVFERSAAAAMPGVEIEVVELPAAATRQEAMALCFLAAAKRAIEAGGEVAVADLDLMFLRDIRPVFRRRFDVAYTVRETSLRYNTGLWFMRPTGRPFVERWCEHTQSMLARPAVHAEAVRRYGGIDQAALAAVVAEGGARTLELPCREWNATQSEWSQVDGSTRVVHVKSALRRQALGQERETPALSALLERWRAWDRA